MSALPTHAVELEGLTKRFTARGMDENGGRRRAVRREITAVDHVDLQIRRVVEGSAKVAERLRREVLYYVAISAPVGVTSSF